ncbi:hypothetical protein NITLEN_20177 [Nitrospira lenta]|uniref:Uncharacterized protein n=1 Tax=Nitrospira lenta TaxID=1436998 RepID=A0A330L4D5_9BACT|nr:hypothetical protein NITLEN_20177 [Nitrospira lenta]
MGWYSVCVEVDKQNPTRQHTGVHDSQRFLSGGILLGIMERAIWLSTGVYKPVHRNSEGL